MIEAIFRALYNFFLKESSFLMSIQQSAKAQPVDIWPTGRSFVIMFQFETRPGRLGSARGRKIHSFLFSFITGTGLIF